MRKEETVTIDLLHRAVPAKYTDEGLRAFSGENPIRPERVQKYLEGKFGDALKMFRKLCLSSRSLCRLLNSQKKPTACTRNSGRIFFLGKEGGGSGKLDLYLIRKTASASP